MTKPAFDPEVQALLQEIVADPESTLLRVPEAPLSKWFAKREPPVTAGEAYLTRTERYLLQEYREEAALLLALACQSALLAKPIEETRIHRHITGGHTLEPTDPAELRARGSRLVERSGGAGFRDPLQMLLGEKAPSDLAAASLRIVPRDETRIWLALALNDEGQPRSALRVLTDVLAHRPTRMNELYARENCGFVLQGQGSFESAVEWYESAADMAEAGFIASLWWFLSSLQAGARSSAQDSAERIDRRSSGLEADAPIVREFLAALSGVAPTPKCSRLAAVIATKLPPVARRITDALARS
jgi:tetratricopeptide (TPR) repeat protein